MTTDELKEYVDKKIEAFETTIDRVVMRLDRLAERLSQQLDGVINDQRAERNENNFEHRTMENRLDELERQS